MNRFTKELWDGCPIEEWSHFVELDGNETKVLGEGWAHPVVVGGVIDRLAAYEDSGLSPEEVQELAKAKADGRLKILKAALFQTVWFYDGANRLMQGKVIEYLDCGNGLIYQVQGAKKGLWLHEHEIFLSQEEALLAVVKKRKRR